MKISETTLKFIQEHAKEDTNALRLKYRGKSLKLDIPLDFALLQIDARKKAQKKIPSFIENSLFIIPDTLSVEQASNETVARYHASLIPSGSRLLDLTSGLGIDDLTFAMSGINVTACEISETKSQALRHNAEVLDLTDNMTVMNVDSMEFVRSSVKHFDVVFADPARRSAGGKRLHALSDCQPDILEGLDVIMHLTERLLVKSSPLLDLTLIRHTVRDLYHIHVVCYRGECKEVLMDIRPSSEFSGITVVDLDTEGTISYFKSHLSPSSSSAKLAERSSPSDYKYLYEPNAGVMKTGAWGELTIQFPLLEKADPSTHLFLSDKFYSDFPGRVMVNTGIPDKKALKGLRGGKYNVVARNHPQSAHEIEKKLSLIPGGERYLYAFRYKGKPFYMLTYPFRRLRQDSI